MAIVINGSGTVTGLAVGGLPDGTVDAGTLATNSVDSAELIDGAVDDSHMAAMAASKLTGTVATANIADNAITLAKMASGTDGNIISFDASGNPVAIATGSDGQVLTSTGAGSPPAFEASAVGGKVLQVVSSYPGAYTTISATSYTSTDQNLAITPTLSSSKILVLYNGHYSSNTTSGSSDHQVNATVYRGSTDLGRGNGTGFHYTYINGTYDSKTFSVSLLDSPNTTSSVTYGIYAKMLYANNAMRFNPGGNATFTLLEIGA